MLYYSSTDAMLICWQHTYLIMTNMKECEVQMADEGGKTGH